MSKKAEIKLGLNGKEAEKDAKKVSQNIKDTLNSSLDKGVQLKVDSKEAEDAIERIKRLEAERTAKASSDAKKRVASEKDAVNSIIAEEQRRASLAQRSAKKRAEDEAWIQKKLQGASNVVGQYDKLSNQYPSTYKGTPNTDKDIAAVNQSIKYVSENLQALSDRELAGFKRKLNDLTYTDLNNVKKLFNSLTTEMIPLVRTFKKFQSVENSLDKMQSAVEKVASSMSKATAKMAPKEQATVDKTNQPIVKAAKEMSGIFQDAKGTQYGIEGMDMSRFAKAFSKAYEQSINKLQVTPGAAGAINQPLSMNRLPVPNMPENITSQYMKMLDHFQSIIDKTMPKVDTTKGKDKIAAVRDLQDRISKSAILTTDMTLQQLTDVSTQMTRMTSTALREMQRAMTALERMFAKMAEQANKTMTTPVLNKELQRQAGEQNLGIGVYKPRARSDTSDDIANQMVKLLSAPKVQEMKLLPAGNQIPDIPLDKLYASFNKVSKVVEDFTVPVEQSRKAIEAWAVARNKDVKDFSMDYKGPMTRQQSAARHNYSQLLLPEGPQDTLQKMFKQLDFSAVTKLADRLAKGEVVNKANVPGGVTSVAAAPDLIKGILQGIPQLNNEDAISAIKQLKDLNFNGIENSVNSIEKTFQTISTMLAKNAQKYANDSGKEASTGEEVSATLRPEVNGFARSLSELSAQVNKVGNSLKNQIYGEQSKRDMEAHGIAPNAPDNEAKIAQQSRAQADLIAASTKLMSAFDALADKVAKDATIPDTTKTQWNANAKAVHQASSRIQRDAGAANPEDTAKATKMINSADVTDAVKLRNNLDQIAAMLSKSKTTMLKDMSKNLKDTAKTAQATNKSLSDIIKSFTTASRASKFLSDGTEAADKAAKKLSGSYKEVSRVVQGIMISRIFYAGLQSVNAMISAVGQLIVQMEQSQVAMAVMLKDYETAQRMMTELADFAAKTPLTNQQADKAGQMLLAYGFEAKNLMPIMRDLADATAATGNPQAFESIARALGQINTKGKVTAEELRQLTEQGIPALAILKEKLNLNEKQVANIGKAGITSDVGISALLKGIQERYGGAAEAISKTTGGMISTIKDNILLMFNEGLKPLKNVFDGVLTNFSEGISNALAIVRESGIGGLFEAMVPESLQGPLKTFVGGIVMLVGAITKLWRALAPVREMFMQIGLAIANFIIPVLATVIIGFANLINVLAANATLMKIVTAALAGFAIGWLAAKSIMLLAKALLFLVSIGKGVVALIQAIRTGTILLGVASSLTAGKVAILVGVLTAVGAIIAALSGKMGGFLSGIGNGLQKMFGIDNTKYFQKQISESTDKVGEFGEEFDANGDAIDTWGDKMKENADKAKNAIMAFDEVFTLTDPEGTLDEGGGNLDEIPMLPGDVQMPEIPDTTIDWDHFFNLDNFLDNFDSIVSWIKELGVYFTSDYWKDKMDGGVWDGFFEGLANVLAGCERAIDGFAEFLAGFITGDLDMIGEGWWNFWNGLGDIVKGLGDIIEGVFDGVIDKLDEFLSWLLGDYYTMFKDCFADCLTDVEGMKDGIFQAFDGIVDMLVGFITGDLDTFSYGWWECLDGIGQFIDNFKNLIFDIFGNLIDYLLGDFLRNFGWVGNQLADILESPKEAIKAIIGNIKDIFGGLIDFVVGVFTGDWERAWEGVSRAFKSVFGGIGNFFIGIINTVIDAINWMIRQINKIGFDLPDFLGGEHIGFSLEEFNRIPYFANGGLIKKETLGIIGEDGTEAILPLEKPSAMKEIANAILAGMEGSRGTGNAPPPTGTEGTPLMNIGVLVADDRSLRKLKTMLDDVSKDTSRGRRD